MSVNIFSKHENYVEIRHPKKSFLGEATLRPDYEEDLCSLSWSIKSGYLYNYKRKISLHQYVMEKWYGKELCQRMKERNFIIEHLDNNHLNCTIENLYFLNHDKNVAKAMSFDKDNMEKEYIALSIFRDPITKLFQMTISFNYPAKLITSKTNEESMVFVAQLLYEDDYVQLLIDAEAILHSYYKNYSFNMDKHNFIDYIIEGAPGKQPPIENYKKYLQGEYGPVFIMNRLYFLKCWEKTEKIERLKILPLYSVDG